MYIKYMHLIPISILYFIVRDSKRMLHYRRKKASISLCLLSLKSCLHFETLMGQGHCLLQIVGYGGVIFLANVLMIQVLLYIMFYSFKMYTLCSIFTFDTLSLMFLHYFSSFCNTYYLSNWVVVGCICR